MKKNKNILITPLIIFIIVFLNVYIRSVKVITVNTNSSEEIISVENKYYNYFNLLNILTVVCFVILFTVNIVLLQLEKKKLNQRLTVMTNLFRDVGLNKLKITDSILTEHDLIIINSWNKSIDEIIDLTTKREQYFSFMVHDLKKPVHMMQAELELYDTQANCIEVINELRKEVSSLEHEITKYLHIEKISFFEKANLKEINVINIFTKYVDEYKKLGFDIKLINQSTNIFLLVDETMLDKILANLCQNAYKYSTNMQLDICIQDKLLIFSNQCTKLSITHDIFNSSIRQQSSNGNGLGSQIICKYIELLNWNISSRVNNEIFEVIIKIN